MDTCMYRLTFRSPELGTVAPTRRYCMRALASGSAFRSSLSRPLSSSRSCSMGYLARLALPEDRCGVRTCNTQWQDIFQGGKWPKPSKKSVARARPPASCTLGLVQGENSKIVFFGGGARGFSGPPPKKKRGGGGGGASKGPPGMGGPPFKSPQTSRRYPFPFHCRCEAGDAFAT